jgi:Uma2 family endonuclease
VVAVTDDQFLEFCSLNGDLRIERSAQGDLIVKSPAGYSSGRRNAELIGQLRDWAKKDLAGEVLDSSTGFTLPNGAVRAPDASWIPQALLAQLTPDQLEKFAPICPPLHG